jgi:hypothetical protein
MKFQVRFILVHVMKFQDLVTDMHILYYMWLLDLICSKTCSSRFRKMNTYGNMVQVLENEHSNLKTDPSLALQCINRTY